MIDEKKVGIQLGFIDEPLHFALDALTDLEDIQIEEIDASIESVEEAIGYLTDVKKMVYRAAKMVDGEDLEPIKEDWPEICSKCEKALGESGICFPCMRESEKKEPEEEEARCTYCCEEFNPEFNLYHYDTNIWFCSKECNDKQDEKTRRENPDMFPPEAEA